MYQRPTDKNRPWWLKGQALVEFALILPTLLFIIMGIIDYGRILLVYSNASGAIRDATRNATLLGNDPDTGDPFYISCPTIIGQAEDILFGTITDLNVLYFDATSSAVVLADLKTDLEGVAADPTLADFECGNATYTLDNPAVTDGDVGTGDLMVVTLDVQIDFITPVLSSVFPSLTLEFRSQRTVVTRIQMVTSGPDRDADGLMDGWELYWFGCLLEDYAEEPTKTGDDRIIAILPGPDDRDRSPFAASYLVDVESRSYVSTSWNPGDPASDNDLAALFSNVEMDDASTPLINEDDPSTWQTANFPSDCEREQLNVVDFASVTLYPEITNTDPLTGTLIDTNFIIHSPDTPYGCDSPAVDDGSGNMVWINCVVPNTYMYSSIDDPDGDECTNGCEEVQNLNPIESDAGGSSDSDGDGMTDGDEVNGYLLVTSYEDMTGASIPINKQLLPPYSVIPLDPTNADSDGDTLEDGYEVYTALQGGSPQSPNTYITDPTEIDTDTDGLGDGMETNCLVDPPNNYCTSPLDMDTDNDLRSDSEEIAPTTLNVFIDGISKPVTFNTNPTNTDSDGDGLSDGVEIAGTSCTPVCVTNPDVEDGFDTDGDGLNDGLEIAGTSCTPLCVTNPTLTDSDGDGLLDGDEVNTYGTLPNNTNTDGNCGTQDEHLEDDFESIGIYVIEAGGLLDPDGDGDKNGADDDSDGDTLSDCDEINVYNTNPYMANTDGDDMDDAAEVIDACRDPLVADNGTSCGSVDSDGDGLPDVWENSYYGDFTLYDGTDDIDEVAGVPTPDGCDNLCEYLGTLDPTNPDTDGDTLLDGNPAEPNPRRYDTDLDGLHDGQEVNGVSFSTTIDGVFFNYGTGLAQSDPLNPDSDYDGLQDSIEILTTMTRFDVKDTDGDGLEDDEEYYGPAFSSIINGTAVNYTFGSASIEPRLGSNPLLSDTDGDGLRDYNEVKVHGTYPNAADTDGDTVRDGSTSTTRGERNSDFDTSILGYGTIATEMDSDNDDLEDNFELFGTSINTSIDGVPTTITVAGYTSTANPKLGIFNTDSDNDELSDGYEVYISKTDPLNGDTDGDSLLDGDEIDNGTDPLTPNNDIDSDGDGILDDDETGDLPPTDPNDPDSDDDGMMDGAESLQVTISATGYNLSTDSTYAITFSNVPVNLDTTHQDNDGDGVKDGYDSDGDGLSDTFEMYWFRTTAQIQAIHPLHTAFSGSMESCGYALTGSQPLHPDDADTDDDGLLDGDECNVYNTNPFSAANEGPIFDKIPSANATFLNQVVYPALEGNLEEAAGGADSLNLTVGSSDGLITVRVWRGIDPGSPGGNKYYLIETFIESVCGDTAYTNNAGITTIFTNRCGEMVGSEPSRNGNDNTTPVLIRIPMSEFFTVLSSNMITQMVPQ